MGTVERLLNVQVGRAGHIADVLQQAIDKFAIALQVVANHLDIDGRRQTEIKNLRHHVHRQGIERGARKLGNQLRAEALHIGIGGMVLFRQSHGDVSVGTADDARAGVGEVYSGIGNTNIVDDADELVLWDLLADGTIYLVAKRRRLLDAGTGRRAKMKLERARVSRGKDILAQPRVQEGKGADRKNKEENEEHRAVGDRELQHAEIEGTKLLKPVFERQLCADQRIEAPVVLILG